MDVTNAKIAIIGLGYVGLPLAAEFGKKHTVVGFDINLSRIQELKKGEDSTLETTSQELKEAVNLIYTENPEDINDCTVFIVTVPTPIDDCNAPDLSALESACEIISRVINKGDIVIFESTVFPGATEDHCAPIIERGSGLKYGTEFFCGYSPERINPGDKKNTIEVPASNLSRVKHSI